MRGNVQIPVKLVTLSIQLDGEEITKRLKTGIEGLDKVITGIPVGRTILVTGDAGSGKTIFGLQFLWSCGQESIKCAYITSEEDASDLRLQSKSFGWELEKLEKAGMLTFVELAGPRANETEATVGIGFQARKGNFSDLLKHIPSDVQVIVVDSLGSHTANLTLHEFRDRFDLLIHSLRKREITGIVILDSATSNEFNDIALFSVYGAIRLMKRENPYTGRRERVIDVVKMRNSVTPVQLLTYEMGSGGISVSAPSDQQTRQ